MLCAIARQHDLLDDVETHRAIRPVGFEQFAKRAFIGRQEAFFLRDRLAFRTQPKSQLLFKGLAKQFESVGQKRDGRPPNDLCGVIGLDPLLQEGGFAVFGIER